MTTRLKFVSRYTGITYLAHRNETDGTVEYQDKTLPTIKEWIHTIHLIEGNIIRQFIKKHAAHHRMFELDDKLEEVARVNEIDDTVNYESMVMIKQSIEGPVENVIPFLDDVISYS